MDHKYLIKIFVEQIQNIMDPYMYKCNVCDDSSIGRSFNIANSWLKPSESLGDTYFLHD